MAEKTVTLRHQQVCDVCGQPISPGERCRFIRDDFDPALRFFEHLRCPDAAVRTPSMPMGSNPPVGDTPSQPTAKGANHGNT